MPTWSAACRPSSSSGPRPRRSASSASPRARRWPSGRRSWPPSRAEALALTQTIAAQSQALRQQLAEMETQLKTGRAALDQLRERPRRALQRSWPSCTPILSILKQAAWPRSTSRPQVLRDDAEIVRLLDEELAAEEETCRTLRAAHRADGPGEHDGPGRVQGDRRAARLP